MTRTLKIISLYVVDKDLGTCMLHFSDDDNTVGLLQVEKEKPVKCIREQEDELWQLYFDGSSCKEGAGAGVLLISPSGETVKLMYKLEFITTNNTAKDLGIQQIYVYGDFELVVQRVRNNYQVKQDLLKVYRNEVWDMIDNYFVAFNITYIPRDHNQTADSLVLAATHFRILKTTKLKYPIEVSYRTSVPDNVRQ